jgi:transposase-like protein
VFVKAVLPGSSNVTIPSGVIDLFKCPDCNSGNLQEKAEHVACPSCGAKWSVQNGIYDFRERMK